MDVHQQKKRLLDRPKLVLAEFTPYDGEAQCLFPLSSHALQGLMTSRFESYFLVNQLCANLKVFVDLRC